MKRKIESTVRKHVTRSDYRTIQDALDASGTLADDLMEVIIKSVGKLYRKYHREVDYDITGSPDVDFVTWLKDYLEMEA